METTTVPATSKPKNKLFINRSFALLWGGQAVSNLGDIIFNTTLMLWIAVIIARDQPWAPLASSGVLLIAAIPTFLIGPIAGVLVDRWDKRRTMLYMDALRAVFILLLLLTTGLVPLPFSPSKQLPAHWQLGAIYVVTFLCTCCAQFFNPARFSLIGEIVEPDQQTHASSLGQITANMALVIGPFLASPLLFVVGVGWALVINTLSFVVSFLAILLVRIPSSSEAAFARKQPDFLHELGEGMDFFRKNRILMTILVSAAIVTFGVGALNTLDVYFVIKNLHAQASLYGLMGTAYGIGSIVGAVLSALLIKRVGVVRCFWLALLVTGILILFFARQKAFISALIIFSIIGVPVVTVNTIIGPLMLRATPHNLVGRVVAIFTPVMSIVAILSISLAGYLASTALHDFQFTLLGIPFGSIDTIFTATGLLAILGGIYAWLSLRSVHMDEREKAVGEATSVAD